jgi:hypothetical protein
MIRHLPELAGIKFSTWFTLNVLINKLCKGIFVDICEVLPKFAGQSASLCDRLVVSADMAEW